MLSRILVATDVSEASGKVVECAKGLHRLGSRFALLAHVMNVRDVGGLYAVLRREIQPKMEAQAKVLEAAGFETRIEISLGAVPEEINRLVGEHSCSLIVTGSYGHSLLRELWLGSTACSLLHGARVPLFLVRIEITDENGGRRCRLACDDPFARILFPTDFSDTAERAFQYLEHIVRETAAAVTLLHVQDEAKLGKYLENRLEEFNRIDMGRLERMRDRLLACGASLVAFEIPFGSPIRLILRRAREGGFSSIVMGSQGRGFIPEIFLGSVAHNVARYAPLPVLFVPAARPGKP